MNSTNEQTGSGSYVYGNVHPNFAAIYQAQLGSVELNAPSCWPSRHRHNTCYFASRFLHLRWIQAQRFQGMTDEFSANLTTILLINQAVTIAGMQFCCLLYSLHLLRLRLFFLHLVTYCPPEVNGDT